MTDTTVSHAEQRLMVVLYGSQTGCAKEVAERIGREAKARCFKAKVKSMEDYVVTDLPNEPLVIAVASTTGQGDAPDNMRQFWSFLLRKSLPPDSLFGMMYAVFGLGDSSYSKYNAVAKRLDRRLEQLGASRLHGIGLGDDQDRNGYDEALDPWLAALWDAVLQKHPLPPGFVVDTSLSLPPARYSVSVTDQKPLAKATTQAPTNGSTGAWDAANPFFAEVVENRLLTKEGADREVRHVEFDIGGSGISFVPGDNVAIQAPNRSEDVDSFASMMGLELDQVIDIQPASADEPPPKPLCGFGAVTVRALLTEHVDFMATPRRYFFELLHFFCSDEVQRERLLELSSVEGRDDLYSYCQKQGRSFLEVLRDFPAARPPPEYLLDLIPPLQPRSYSISSSPSAHPTRISVTIAVVAYQAKTLLPRYGICTTFLKRSLARADCRSGSLVPVWVRSGTLQLPAPRTSTLPPPWADDKPPLLLVGPGTGVAPLRSFLQERQYWREQRRAGGGGADTSRDLLFFGCRNQLVDYLYREEWEEMVAGKHLVHLGVAFSRDQTEKVYVQHRIRAAGPLVWQALEGGAVVMVCGSSEKMPRDVREALRDVVQKEGGLEEAGAEEYLKRMETQRRYLLDTWS